MAGPPPRPSGLPGFLGESKADMNYLRFLTFLQAHVGLWKTRSSARPAAAEANDLWQWCSSPITTLPPELEKIKHGSLPIPRIISGGRFPPGELSIELEMTSGSCRQAVAGVIAIADEVRTVHTVIA